MFNSSALLAHVYISANSPRRGPQGGGRGGGRTVMANEILPSCPAASCILIHTQLGCPVSSRPSHRPVVPKMCFNPYQPSLKQEQFSLLVTALALPSTLEVARDKLVHPSPSGHPSALPIQVSLPSSEPTAPS